MTSDAQQIENAFATKLSALAENGVNRVAPAASVRLDVANEPLSTDFSVAQGNGSPISAQGNAVLNHPAKLIREKCKPRRQPNGGRVTRCAASTNGSGDDVQPDTTKQFVALLHRARSPSFAITHIFSGEL